MEAVAAEAEATAAVVAGTNLEDAVSKVKATLATVPAKSRLLKRSLKATPADNTKDNTTSNKEDIERANMIKSLVRVKEVVGETAKQFNLSQKEVLRMASDQFKEEQRQKVVVLQPQLPTRPPVQIKLPTEPDKGVAEMLHKKRQRKSESNNNNEGEGEATTSFSTPMSRPPSLQILLQSAGSSTPSTSSTKTVVVTPSTTLKIQQVPIQVTLVQKPSAAPLATTSVTSSSTSSRQPPPSTPAPSTSQRSATSDATNRRPVTKEATATTSKKPAATEETSEPVDLPVQQVLAASNKSHVQALLKLRQYKKNLKYAIWDYQDGQPISVAARRYRLPTNVVQYSVDLILRESGQSLEELLENKDQDVEAASSRAGTSAYEEALRRGIALVKDRKAASLLDAAKRAGGLSIFDLTEKLAREVEIESRLRRLQPVEPQINLDTDMLSDIDEVIRDDSAKSHEVAAAFVVADENNGDGGGGDSNGASGEAATVVEANDAGVMHMVVEVCGVCTKAFTDNAAYREHEAAGCIDYD